MTNKHIADIGTGWPKLPPLEAWQDTCNTLHMWTQIVGKVRLMLSPDINHCWGSTLYVTARGLTTSPIPYGVFTFAIDFDFIAHTLHITTSKGADHTLALEPMSVADFYHKIMQTLRELGIEVKILARPVEVEVAIPFEKDDQHASYDKDAVSLFWRALVQVDCVLKDFRARFIGKVSPVHFFWGAFDLAVTRFSGRTAPKHPGGRAQRCRPCNGRSVFARGIERGLLAGNRPGRGCLLCLCLSQPCGFQRVQGSAGDSLFS